MKIKITIGIFLLLGFELGAQIFNFKPDDGPIKVKTSTDHELITILFKELQHSINVSGGFTNRFLSEDFEHEPDAQKMADDLKVFKINLENVDIEIRDEISIVKAELLLSDGSNVEDSLLLIKAENRWLIKQSKYLVKLNELKQNKNGNINAFINPRIQSFISQLQFANTALIQRPAFYTDLMTINRSISKQFLNLALYADVFDGKIVKLINNDFFGATIDDNFGRMIYFSYDGSWIKSYGHNAGDHKIISPRDVTVDKFGNIFVMDWFPPGKLVHLFYSPSDELVSYVREIDLQNCTPVPNGFAVDCNSTRENIYDDYFWITGRYENTIYKLDWNGVKLGAYTKITNPYKSETTFIYTPTKISVSIDGAPYKMAFIDSDNKRVVIVTEIYGYQDDEILGNYFYVRFSNNLNTNLNSISYQLGYSGETIWVSDERNGMFHIISPTTGYLASINNLDNISQWNKPRHMISTRMSNSASDYYGLISIDEWGNERGFNTYYEGAELRNIFARYNVPSFCSPINTNIYGTFLTRSKVNIDLHYYKANLINRVMTDFNFDCNKDWPIFQFCNPYLPGAVGKYTAKIFVEPQDNDNYGDWQMTPLEYNFHFALPVSGALNGPSQFSNCSDLTFNVDIQSGSGDFTYSWFIRKGSNHSWVPLSANSNQLILPVNDGNTTFTLRCDVHDSFNNTDISLSKTVSGITQIGTLSSNETWCGNIEICGDVIVPRDITLSIEPGALLSFINNASLIIDGSLISNGGYNNKIGFNFISPDNEYENGIKINQGGTANISYAVIDNAYIGITINETNADINNCEISNCGRGIYLYRTNYANEDSWLMDNKIRDCYWYGISMYQSSPYIIGNELHDNGMALLCDQYSSPYLGYADSYGNNYIHNNSIGLFANFSSNPFLGRTGCIAFGGANSFVNQTSYHIEALNYCEILAENNWWDSFAGKFYSYNSNIDYEPYLESPPFNNLNNMKNSPEELAFDSKFAQRGFDSKVTTEEKELGFQNDWCIKWKLLYARNLIEVKKYKQAQKICKDVIEEYPDSSLTHYAVDLLWQASRRGDNDSLKGFFKKLSNKKAKKKLYASAEKILAGFERNLRIENLDRIIAKYSGEQILEAVLFDKFIYYFKEQKNKQLARDISNQLDSLFPGTHTALEAHRFLGDTQPGGNMLSKANLGAENTVVTGADNLPKEYELRGNYPNPFNPSTTISYGLPEESKVQITVYDILGTRVTELVNENQSAGYYNVAFDARNLSSGIYIYRFTAVKPDGKYFERVSKLMLVK